MRAACVCKHIVVDPYMIKVAASHRQSSHVEDGRVRGRDLEYTMNGQM